MSTYTYCPKKERGFTLIELLVVLTIIGVLVTVTLAALHSVQVKARDDGRKAQSQELIKVLELYYNDNGSYPIDDGGVAGYEMLSIINELLATPYLATVPQNTGDFKYCSAGGSYVVGINTEDDKGGSDYCNILRGPGPNYGCDYTGGDFDGADGCLSRF